MGRRLAMAVVAGLAVSGAVVIVASTAVAGPPFSDEFNRADSTNLGSGWAEVGGGLEIVGNKLTSNNNNPLDLGVVNGVAGNRVAADISARQAPTAETPYVALILGYTAPANLLFVGFYDWDSNGTFDRLMVLDANGQGNVLGLKALIPFVSGRAQATLVGQQLTVTVTGGPGIKEVFQLAQAPTGSGVGVGIFNGGTVDDFASSDFTPSQPTITAELVSDSPPTASGWYRSQVFVAYSCTPDGSPLVQPCPSGDVVAEEGKGRTVSRTITAEDGGQATVSVTVDLDKTAPVASLKGVVKAPYLEDPRKTVRCVGTDTLSGIGSCLVTTKKLGGGKVRLSAVATDRAGNQDLDEAVVRTATSGILKAEYVKGAYAVKRGKKYTVVVLGKAKPEFLGFRSHAAKPQAFKKKNGRWELRIKVPGGLVLGKEGVRIRKIGTSGTTFTLPVVVRR